MHLLQALTEIYQKPSNILQTALWTLFFGACVSLLQNLSQIISVFGYSLPIVEKVQVTYSILINLYTHNLTGLTLLSHCTLILLMAINLTCIVYFFKKRGSMISSSETTLATVFALLGSSCAACGGILASAGIATLGGFSSILISPFVGNLFVYSAIVLLLYSIYSITHKISAPLIC
ncbi:MAG: hypothetical protein RI996_220 [Candidatus Parcubacteria bacterium]|jgi:hypothetical protein